MQGCVDTKPKFNVSLFNTSFSTSSKPNFETLLPRLKSHVSGLEVGFRMSGGAEI